MSQLNPNFLYTFYLLFPSYSFSICQPIERKYCSTVPFLSQPIIFKYFKVTRFTKIPCAFGTKAVPQIIFSQNTSDVSHLYTFYLLFPSYSFSICQPIERKYCSTVPFLSQPIIFKYFKVTRFTKNPCAFGTKAVPQIIFSQNTSDVSQFF